MPSIFGINYTMCDLTIEVYLPQMGLMQLEGAILIEVVSGGLGVTPSPHLVTSCIDYCWKKSGLQRKHTTERNGMARHNLRIQKGT